jgi:hypothetical protein
MNQISGKEGEDNNTDGHNGHSRRIQERLIAYRRDQVFALSTKGY